MTTYSWTAGANRGIGLEFTRQFLERGNQLFVGVRNPKDIKDLQSLQQKHSGQLEISQLDISKTSSIQVGIAHQLPVSPMLVQACSQQN